MPQTSQDPTFLCHDLESSAYLWVRGVRFVGIDCAPTPTNPNHVVFRFYDPDRLSRHEFLAFRKGVAIPAKQYAIALKLLRDQVLRCIIA
jgi:hypothetical protein